MGGRPRISGAPHSYGYKGKQLELTPVSRSEFEALRRFGDYTELLDGTLLRIEGDKEFRIYLEDSDWPSGIIVTEGVLSMLSGEFDEPCPRDHASE